MLCHFYSILLLFYSSPSFCCWALVQMFYGYENHKPFFSLLQLTLFTVNHLPLVAWYYRLNQVGLVPSHMLNYPVPSIKKSRIFSFFPCSCALSSNLAWFYSHTCVLVVSFLKNFRNCHWLTKKNNQLESNVWRRHHYLQPSSSMSGEFYNCYIPNLFQWKLRISPIDRFLLVCLLSRWIVKQVHISTASWWWWPLRWCSRWLCSITTTEQQRLTTCHFG